MGLPPALAGHRATASPYRSAIVVCGDGRRRTVSRHPVGHRRGRQVWFLADGLNADIDEVVATVEAVPANTDHQIFDHLLRAGTSEYPAHWPAPAHGWTLTIEGDPSMRTQFFCLASFARAASMEEHVRCASVATAMQVLNAVPAVCDATPGFATMASLPLIRSHTGFGHRG